MDRSEPDINTTSNPSEQTEDVPASPAELDINKLAERVYQLMLAEARLERARGTQPARRERRERM
jgi:hypothetical protein